MNPEDDFGPGDDDEGMATHSEAQPLKRRSTDHDNWATRHATGLLVLLSFLTAIVVIAAAVTSISSFTRLHSQTVKLNRQVMLDAHLTRSVADVQAAQKANASTALANRVYNVNTWCHAINEGRDYARARAGQNNLTRYTLKDLDCAALAAGTAAAATPQLPTSP